MTNKEVAQKIVDRMLDAIKADGKLPWTKPWKAGKESVRVLDGFTEITVTPRHWSRSGKPYNGINPLLLDLSGKQGEWITWNQAKAEGGKVKKGAKSSTIIYWNMVKKTTDELDENGEKIIKLIPTLKYYNVFSVEDVEGIEPKHQPDPIVITIPRWHYETEDVEIDESLYNPAAESIIADYIKRAGTLTLDRDGASNEAYYQPALDHVVTPNITQFSDHSEFYSTLFHELGHSTGHSSRLNRFTGKAANAAFGSQEYSKEELVAEITAASILSTLGLESGNSFRNSAAYVQGWSSKIKDDPMMFVSAAGKAEKAIDLIMGMAV